MALQNTLATCIIGAGLLVGSPASATSIIATIDAQSGPWISSLNPSFNWGNSTLPPTEINSPEDLPFSAGDIITFTYLDGTTYGGGGITSDANGDAASFGNLSGSNGSTSSPSHYIDSNLYPTIYFVALLGAFTNGAGVIVDQPFLIGNGPFSIAVPNGASGITLGFNDGNNGFGDNSDSLRVNITVPEPAAITLFCTMLLGLGMVHRRSYPRTAFAFIRSRQLS